MTINPNYKVREVANEHIIIKRSAEGADMMNVVGLNATSVELYEALKGRDFTLDDIVAYLVDHYQVDNVTARGDAVRWLAQMKEHGIVI